MEQTKRKLILIVVSIFVVVVVSMYVLAGCGVTKLRAWAEIIDRYNLYAWNVDIDNVDKVVWSIDARHFGTDDLSLTDLKNELEKQENCIVEQFELHEGLIDVGRVGFKDITSALLISIAYDSVTNNDELTAYFCVVDVPNNDDDQNVYKSYNNLYAVVTPSLLLGGGYIWSILAPVHYMSTMIDEVDPQHHYRVGVNRDFEDIVDFYTNDRHVLVDIDNSCIYLSNPNNQIVKMSYIQDTFNGNYLDIYLS